MKPGANAASLDTEIWEDELAAEPTGSLEFSADALELQLDACCCQTCFDPLQDDEVSGSDVEDQQWTRNDVDDLGVMDMYIYIYILQTI